MVRAFANGPTQKMLLDASLLNTQYYQVRIKGKWSSLEKEVTHFPTLFSNY